MRAAFVQALVARARADRRIVLLTGDLGFMALEPFADEFPDRFYNVGVAEQCMVGLATGLAEAGFLPFVYSIVNFAVLRPYEFIRNGPVLHSLPVRIVGMGGGLEYGPAGPTHHGLEDIGVMRLQPGLTVVAPADHRQVRRALETTWDLPGPVYYRLGKNDTAEVRGLQGRFELGRVQVVRRGHDALLLATGGIAPVVEEAAEALGRAGVSCGLAVVASISPPPLDDLLTLLAQHRIAFCIEAHYLAGGLGSLVCEVAAGSGIPCRVVRLGVPEGPHGSTGGQAFLETRAGLSRDALVARVLASVAPASPPGGGARC